jgi:hypothetical protein
MPVVSACSVRIQPATRTTISRREFSGSSTLPAKRALFVSGARRTFSMRTPMFCTTTGSIESRLALPALPELIGVSSMWQIGHRPGESWITCGCMPQVQS